MDSIASSYLECHNPSGQTKDDLGAMRIKLTNMLSIFADSLGQQASRLNLL